MINQSPLAVLPSPRKICLKMESLLIESDVRAEVERCEGFEPDISIDEMNIERRDFEAKV